MYYKEEKPRSNPLTPISSRNRPPTQFPSKYNYLPEINTPRQGDTSLVPVLPRKNSPGLRTAYNDLDSDERLRQLEVRLNVSERSNRALLEEVLRLQGEVKTVTRRSDDILREEKAARHGLESAMKMNNELITQLSTRIKEAEEKIAEEKSALSSLVNHTKGVEHAVKSSQNELVAKKDVQSTRLIEMRGEIEDLLQAKGQLERITLQLSDDIRTLKMRIDQHNSDFSTVSQDLRTRSKKLEEDNRAQLDALRKTTSVQSHSEQQTTQLRSQVETRLTELRDVLVELRAKQESETADRRTSEQQTSQKFHDLQQILGESNRKRDEGLHAVDMMLREKDHIIQADRLALTSKVADTVEDVNKKILSKEIKIREDIQERYIQLERLIQHEQQQRREYEKTQREEVDRKFFTLKHAVEELSLELKEAMKGDKAKMKGTVQKLDESISLLEKQTLENRKQFEKVMGAEISQRKLHERSTTEKIDGVNEKLQIATSSLQQSIGGITQNMSTQLEKIRRESRSIITEQKDSTTRAMTDLDARVNFMKTRMNDFEEKLEARVATSKSTSDNGDKDATQLLSENMREKVDNISMWQDTTQQTIKELSISVQKMPEEIYALQEKQTLMKSEVSSRLNAESDARMRDVEFIKQELQGLKTRRDPTPATKQDVENLNASVRKLADSIQTVKTVLGMKIQSEQKLRVSGLEDLQTQVNQIRVNTGIGTIYTTRPDYLHSDLDTGIGSWDDPTPSHARGSKDITSRADADPYNKGPGAESNANMATIKEGTETNRTNRTKTPVTPTGDKGKTSPPRNETPSWSRTATPAGKKNATPLASRNATPAQSRNATPAQSRNATPSQSRNATPTQNGNRQNGNEQTQKENTVPKPAQNENNLPAQNENSSAQKVTAQADDSTAQKENASIAQNANNTTQNENDTAQNENNTAQNENKNVSDNENENKTKAQDNENNKNDDKVPSRTVTPAQNVTDPTQTQNATSTKSRNPTPTQSRVPTPSQTQNVTSPKSRNPTPTQSRVPTPSQTQNVTSPKSRNPTPTQSRVPTPPQTQNATSSKSLNPTPTQGRVPTPSQNQNATDPSTQNRNATPTKSRAATPVRSGNATPPKNQTASQSRNATPDAGKTAGNAGNETNQDEKLTGENMAAV